MSLDPHIRRLLKTLSLAAGSGTEPPSLPQRREAFRGLMRLADIGSKVASVTEREVPGPDAPVRLRIYSPIGDEATDLPGLVYLHGGGFICGDLDTHDPFCRTLCDATGCRVIAIGYRLAPEHRFPAALEDALAAVLWVIDHTALIGVDASRIAVCGDSAGATLAAVTCNRLVRNRPGSVALQVLLCPILAGSADTDSRRELSEGYFLATRHLAEEMALYLPPGQDTQDPQVAPERNDDFRGLPPTLIHTAAFDPLRDEGEAYAEALRNAGVEVRHTCHPGMIHLFYAFGRVVPYAQQLHRQLGAEIAAVFGHG